MKTIKTTEAVGHVLCHDITQIIRGKVKDVAFRKGHIVKKEDINVLLSLGKDHLYVWEKQEGFLHENEAAEILYQLCTNDGIEPTEVKEGKITLVAGCDGLFKVDVERLKAVNMIKDIMIASRHTNVPVKKGDKLAGTRVIPLIIEESQLEQAKNVGKDRPLMAIKPYKKMKVGIVTTGNEVFYKRIKDTFSPVIIAKLAYFNLTDIKHTIVDDQVENIQKAIEDMISKGCEMIITTGGMSVDPDDCTPGAIKRVATEVVSYGAPVLPGAMFLMAYKNQVPIMGLPGCAMYAKTTIFDLVLPRVLACEKISKDFLAGLGHGGLCLGCEICTYPACSLGKGSDYL